MNIMAAWLTTFEPFVLISFQGLRLKQFRVFFTAVVLFKIFHPFIHVNPLYLATFGMKHAAMLKIQSRHGYSKYLTYTQICHVHCSKFCHFKKCTLYIQYLFQVPHVQTRFLARDMSIANKMARNIGFHESKDEIFSKLFLVL